MSDDTLEIERFQGEPPGGDIYVWKSFSLLVISVAAQIRNKFLLIWGLLCSSPSVIRMVALHYVVILGLFNHLHLGKEFGKGDWIDRARDINLIKQDT